MMRCLILLTVFMGSNDLKRFIIPEHRKNDVADFVHNGSDRYAFLLAFAFAFVGVVVVDDRIYRFFCPFIHLKVIERHHVQDTPGKAGTPLGHVDFVTVELAGLFYGRVKPEVRVEFLG